MPTTTPFNNLITFSRGSNATVTGPNGLIQWAPNNLLTFSEQFDNAAWTKSNVTVTANNAAAPDGTTTAELVTPTAADCNVRQSFTPAGAVQYTFSVWLRSATGSDISTSIRAWRDSPFQSAGIATITVTPTWERFTLTFTALDATSHFVVVGAGSTLSTGENLSIWGAQLEIGPTATTYNSTTVKNLLGFSEAFDNAGWQKLGSSIVTGAQANPVNGLFNAQKLMEDTSTGIHRTFQTVTIAAGPHTLSFYAKSAGRDWIYINASGALYTAFVNVATGAVGATVGSPTVTMTPIGSGWYRVAMTYQNATAGASNQQIWLASNSTTTSYTGDGNSGVYIYGAQLSDSASLDPYVPTPGAAPSSTAFYGPRFDFDPVTLLPRGLLVEEQRTNLLLNSLITGANLSTQNVTVTAVAHTISFYGTGSITLSGAHSATVNGTGAYPTRTTLTFTPTAGTLTCTVSGTVQFANLEAGAFATSYIPTVASTVTRSADVATITGQNFAQWYRADEGALAVNMSLNALSTTANQVGAAIVTDNNNAITVAGNNAAGTRYATVATLGVNQGFLVFAGATANVVQKLSYAYRTNDTAFSADGATAVTDNTVSLPVVNNLQIGFQMSGNYANGHIRSIRFIPARAADFQLQGLST